MGHALERPPLAPVNVEIAGKTMECAPEIVLTVPQQAHRRRAQIALQQCMEHAWKCMEATSTLHAKHIHSKSSMVNTPRLGGVPRSSLTTRTHRAHRSARPTRSTHSDACVKIWRHLPPFAPMSSTQSVEPRGSGARAQKSALRDRLQCPRSLLSPLASIGRAAGPPLLAPVGSLEARIPSGTYSTGSTPYIQ